MATPHPHIGPVGPDTLITVKVIIDGTNRRFKLALRDLGANVLPQKLRSLLAIPPEQDVRFDRFSDSQARYITLDSNDPAIYKQLYRAAKAKLKLRLRATVEGKPARDGLVQDVDMAQSKFAVKDGADSQAEPRNNFLETVLSQPLGNSVAPSFKAFQKTCQFSPKCAIPGAFDVDVNTSSMDQAAVNGTQGNQSDMFSLPTLPTMNDFPATSYTIDCNRCGQSVLNEHYHCGICEGGDFDLCKACVDAGVTCDGDEHWLLKRTVRNGMVIPSTTETLAPKKLSKAAADSSSELTTPISPERDDTELTCNSCIFRLSAGECVTCQECPDYDLCLSCFQDGQHGHDPSHTFEARDSDKVKYNLDIQTLCRPGRGVRHDAICDGCEQAIYGVRHKCLSCPDFDYCSACIGIASAKHPFHRFVPIYVPIKTLRTTKPPHRGIYCDGPLCTSYKRYITGDRYKCAVCNDTDFCANCEALPNNGHNPSHPLIKIKLPLRHVSITTQQENENGQKVAQLGDRPTAKNAATETTQSTSANAATQVQTVAEVDPVETTPMVEVAKANDATSVKPIASDLQAWYVTDSTPDGTKVAPNHFVSQSWTLRNPGPDAWPAGCAVYYIGGDDMRNLDILHPSSISAMTMANRSNVWAAPVEPGETARFTVLLKSPAREGRAISYWRLKTPGGVPFGHKLWVDIEVRSTLVELPIRSHILPLAPVTAKSVSEQGEADDQSQTSSTMIFPKLEKESPVSSVHDVRETQVEEAPVAVMEPTIKADEHELLEDVESLELEESDSDGEGFLTDEEYDILDASDEDLLMGGPTHVGK
ncbi:uncharacterized protein Z520_00999 [Fonsecaea multimorphosa CBS 102226]|uniref:ZZ-type domain-containing protein n=1 Tax=Fonsecaea multimorphosa CBS 102226 TaxID=1442371 RepID=A0A0D2L0J0_9EURO|nr:uncharacterized protein Z520_00999 [Fonsecaea multimorphosa CBS 102226]KIY02534.1 hypothetical protein Z520_00999 [Fonsecaea multimorphosa CBS 102226]OAL31401.1 hypothetical protein AYO22_00993 [Fonsecaea multimorphosa]